MNTLENRIVETYGNRLRVRVCGICFENDAVLVVNHHSLHGRSDFWSPPGGGMEFGMSASENLKREFAEETGLIVEVEKFLFVHEYLEPPLHAIELFFQVKRLSGELTKGYDPEMNSEEQIIKEVRFIGTAELIELPTVNVHQALSSYIRKSGPTIMQGYTLYDCN